MMETISLEMKSCTNNILTGFHASHLQRVLKRLFMGRGRVRCSSCASTVIIILIDTYNSRCSLSREIEVITKLYKTP